MWMPWTCRSEGKWPSRLTGKQSISTITSCWSLLILYSAISALEQTYCALVACGSEWMKLFIAFFFFFLQYPPKWYTYSAVWLLHGWCHVKLLPSRRVLCTPCNHTPCHVTVGFIAVQYLQVVFAIQTLTPPFASLLTAACQQQLEHWLIKSSHSFVEVDYGLD